MIDSEINIFITCTYQYHSKFIVMSKDDRGPVSLSIQQQALCPENTAISARSYYVCMYVCMFPCFSMLYATLCTAGLLYV